MGGGLGRGARDGGEDEGLAAAVLPEPGAHLQDVGAGEGVLRPLRGAGGRGLAGLRLPGVGGEQGGSGGGGGGGGEGGGRGSGQGDPGELRVLDLAPLRCVVMIVRMRMLMVVKVEVLVEMVGVQTVGVPMAAVVVRVVVVVVVVVCLAVICGFICQVCIAAAPQVSNSEPEK